MSVLLDVRYHIQKSRRAKSKLIHSDRLKPYHRPALKSWISEKKEAVTPAESRVASAGEIQGTASLIAMLPPTLYILLLSTGDGGNVRQC